MAKVRPFHSKKAGTKVYHNNNKCYLGNDIETENQVPGDGNLRLCKICERINKQRK